MTALQHPAEPLSNLPERECAGNEGLICPFEHRYAPVPLTCLNDYIGGGSHYWHLQCPSCGREYAFDTYRFALEPLSHGMGQT